MRITLTGFLAAIFILLAPTSPAAHAGGHIPDRLKILVYGASGKVGRHVVDEALRRGHSVTAVSRDPARINKTHDRLSVARGDILDKQSIAALVAGQDVVIISVRGVVGKSRDPNDAVPRIAVENVVDAIRAMGKVAPRLIHVGGSGSLEARPGVTYADRLPMIFIPRRLQTEIEGQVLALEYLRGVSDVKWTYATPPKNFTNGKRTGVFRIGGDRILKDSLGRCRVSRADFAVALIDEAERAEHIGKRFSVAY